MSISGVAKRIEAYAGRPNELIQALQLVQEELGYVSAEVQGQIAETLGVSIGQVHGVVTFYHLFRTRPAGRHTIRLCLGSACHVLGADRILTALERQLRIPVGGTTEDGLFTLDVVRCLGTCSLAPVMMIDEDVHGRLTPDRVFAILETYAMSKEEPG
jgi:NADH:ubiquinone oxidoreductase subunit E